MSVRNSDESNVEEQTDHVIVLPDDGDKTPEGNYNEPTTYIAIDGVSRSEIDDGDEEALEVSITNFLLTAFDYAVTNVRIISEPETKSSQVKFGDDV